MKLNFWQWLGVILLLIGLVLYAYKRTRPPAAPATTQNLGTAPVVQPTR